MVLVTTAGTRSEDKGTYFLACGKLGTRTAEISESAWRAFRLAVEGASDLFKAKQPNPGWDTTARQPTAPVDLRRAANRPPPGGHPAPVAR